MARVAPFEEEVWGTSVFSRLARTQYKALAIMRWRLLTNRMRSVQGAFELGARGITFMVYCTMGLGLAVGLGGGAFSIASRGRWEFLPIVFWAVFLVWQVIPIALASFQEQFDLSGLLRFPVNFGSFYLLHIVFGMVDVSALLGGICCVGIWLGITIARPELFLWAALALIIYAVFNVLLARAILSWIDRWLAQRRTREIVSAVFLLFMLSLQLLNPALRQNRNRVHARSSSAEYAEQQKVINEVQPWTRATGAVAIWLPPGLASEGLGERAEEKTPAALRSLGVLGLYVLAAGAVLAVRLKAEYRGENLGEAPARKKVTQRENKWLLDGSGPIAAVMEKELRTVPRSMPLLFAMGGPLLTVLIIGTVLRNATNPSGHQFVLAFPLCVAYSLLGFTQMIYNNLGAEGTGIQLLFLSPTPIRTVLLAKNLLHALLFCVVGAIAGVFAIWRLGVPDGAIGAATAAWLLFALPTNIAAGNILSLIMPYRVNLGRMSRQRGSQASALLSMLIQVCVVAVGAGVFLLCNHFEKLWLAAPVFIVLSGVMVFVWIRILRNADGMANQHRENLIAILAKTE